VGVGAGWMEEEFAALQVPFHDRGARLDEWLSLMRACWTGSPRPFSSGRYRLPDGVFCHPVPVGTLPVLVGGMSAPALRRVGRIGDGWLAQQEPGALDPDALARARAAISAAASAAGRPVPRRTVLRVPGNAAEELGLRLPALAAAGVSDVVVDVDWLDPSGPGRAVQLLRR